jgi:transcriptional regulator with XRE-family HTH domain
MSDRQAARATLRDFLISRRARVTPGEAGLPPDGKPRRVKGLRREEVALLAGISPEYYVRLERGQAAGASENVIASVAAVLRLDDDEREHLSQLLASLGPRTRAATGGGARAAVRPGIQVLLEALDHLPAFVFNGRLDVVASNSLGRALYAPVFQDAPEAPNMARFMFLDETVSHEFWPRWSTMSDDIVALLRTEAGRHPDDPALVELIGQLSAGSQEFRTRWAAHNVRQHRPGVKTLRHPLIGEVTLPYEDLHVDGAADQLLMVYTPEPGSAEHDALRLLASWAADSPDVARSHHQ